MPLAPNHSYVTADFLDKIHTLTIPPQAILGSFDIVSLYTSIEHVYGLEAVRMALVKSQFDDHSREFVLQLLEIVLECNYFMFQQRFYLQLRGTAMGANMAPTYANIFVTMLEERYVYVSHHANHLLAWWRYIDDIFFVWTGSESQLVAFHEFLNLMNPSIKFTLSTSTTSISFLDTEVVLSEGRLLSKLYVKPTDKNTLLRYESAHPRRMVNSLPHSQLLRVKKIVSVPTVLEETLKGMGDKFIQRGYPKSLVQNQISKVQLMGREEVAHGKTSSKLDRIPFISTYGEFGSKIAGVINKHWPIMTNTFPSIPEFQTRPLMSYRRPQNLKDRLVKTCLPSNKQSTQRTLSKVKPGNYPCRNCISCSLMFKGDSFTHPLTKEVFKIRHFMTCSTDWVVYIIWCPCQLLYVGETKCEFKVRLNNHRYTIRKQRADLPVSKHFLDAGHSEKDLKFMLLEHIPLPPRGGDRLAILMKRELWWIFRLNTLKPHGLNVDFKIH